MPVDREGYLYRHQVAEAILGWTEVPATNILTYIMSKYTNVQPHMSVAINYIDS